MADRKASVEVIDELKASYKAHNFTLGALW
jgi:hypothetical protein